MKVGYQLLSILFMIVLVLLKCVIVGLYEDAVVEFWVLAAPIWVGEEVGDVVGFGAAGGDGVAVGGEFFVELVATLL